MTELTAEVDNSLQWARRGKKSSHFFLTFPRKNPEISKNFSGLFDIERELNEFEIFDSEIERWEKTSVNPNADELEERKIQNYEIFWEFPRGVSVSKVR